MSKPIFRQSKMHYLGLQIDDFFPRGAQGIVAFWTVSNQKHVALLALVSVKGLVSKD